MIAASEDVTELVIKEAEKSDSGVYVLHLENKCGKKIVQIKVKVIGRPSAPEGPLGINRTDDGTYRCKVVNEYGEDTRSVRFGVTITVHPEPRVMWLKSGQKISPGDDDRKYTFVSDKGLYQLVIKNLDPDDDAEYSVVARNRYGDDSCKARLTVVPRPAPADNTLRPMFKRLLANLECREGQSVRFEIRVSGVPVLKWEKDGTPLAFGPQIEVVHEGLDYFVLHIRDTLPEDSGTYRVTATNSAGSASCQATLKVERVTHVKKDFETKATSATSETQVSETVTEIKSSEIKTAEITTAEITTAEIKTAEITTAEIKTETTETIVHEEYASYETKLEEVVTVEEAVVEVKKSTLPATILTKPQSLTVSEGESAKFTCDVDGEPAPSVTWMKEGKTIVSSSRHMVTSTEYKSTFEISKVEVSDDGSYTVIVENEEGKQEAQFTLTVRKATPVQKALASPPRVKSPESPRLKSPFGIKSPPRIKSPEPIRSPQRVKSPLTAKSPTPKSPTQKETKPAFSTELSNISASSETIVKLTVKLTGEPKPLISWMKDGKVQCFSAEPVPPLGGSLAYILCVCVL
uniref:Ig-like domain-containing protein n=1 Tax=Astyanax mexicanus TaxID=7994 RepID=A0A3B1J0E6_ASTMX